MHQKFLKYGLLLLPLLCVGTVLLLRESPPEPLTVPAGTEEERLAFLRSEGWEGTYIASQTVTVPAEDGVFSAYAGLQRSRGLPLDEYVGREAVIYTYSLRHTTLCAELLTADGILIGAQCYDPEVHLTLDLRGELFSP